MELKSLQNQFDLKELELNALLEITQAINNNLPEISLYKIYGFIVRANLKINKLALFVKEDGGWMCKENYGTNTNFLPQELDPIFLQLKKIQRIENSATFSPFSEFDLVIPAMHKEEKLAFIFIGGVIHEHEDQFNLDTSFIETLSNILLVAIENKRLARKELQQEAIRKEMEIARGVQQLLFPKVLPHSDHLTVASLYLPHQDVGGDYYDYIEINSGQFVLCIADVSGKGVPAALLMSNFQATLRTMIRHSTNLKEVITELNHQTERSARGENFITFFIAIVDVIEKELYYVNAGHNPPFVIIDSQAPKYLELGTTILGSFEPLPFLKVGRITYQRELVFFSYTDGLTETFDEQQEPFGVERVTDLVEKHQRATLEEINSELLSELNNFRGKNPYNDDITLLSCKVLAEV